MFAFLQRSNFCTSLKSSATSARENWLYSECKKSPYSKNVVSQRLKMPLSAHILQRRNKRIWHI
ncbi:hypothetical protein M989_03938 [Kluyvera georgiana ATCC 51603]|uniref:Uncharacterized protein n=1 Tax=Kluyvera georgiana ATCC 51603 TaxID=1354264 RepID=A0A1B7JIH3_9ENTR|nr:hypothetical protein M989_03938 [Kluyvera georgiana ATCC 51603]